MVRAPSHPRDRYLGPVGRSPSGARSLRRFPVPVRKGLTCNALEKTRPAGKATWTRSACSRQGAKLDWDPSWVAPRRCCTDRVRADRALPTSPRSTCRGPARCEMTTHGTESRELHHGCDETLISIPTSLHRLLGAYGESTGRPFLNWGLTLPRTSEVGQSRRPMRDARPSTNSRGSVHRTQNLHSD